MGALSSVCGTLNLPLFIQLFLLFLFPVAVAVCCTHVGTANALGKCAARLVG